MAEKKHSTLSLIAFASPSIGIAALGLPLAVHLPAYYAGAMGLGLVAVGGIFTLARLWDVFIDPLLGVLSDRFPSRWGRRRHWIVLSVPLIMVASYFVFIPSGGLVWLNALRAVFGAAPLTAVTANYLLGGLFALYLGFTMLLLAHMSWGAELSENYNERSRIQGWREGLSVLGVPLVLMLPVIIQKIGAVGAEHQSVEIIGWFIVVALPLTVFAAVTLMGEEKSKPQPKVSMKEAIGPLMHNGGLQRLVIADLASGFSTSALGAMFIYQASYVWQVGTYTNQLLLLYFFAGVGFVPVALKFSYRFGKHRTMVGASMFNVVFVPLLFLIPPGNIWIASLILIFLGVNVGTPSVLYRSMMADVGDYDEVHTGLRRTGLFYALLTLTAKVGSAFAIGVVYWILARIGFDPTSHHNTPDVLTRLNIIFVAVPFFCNLFVVAIMFRFPIGLKEQVELRRKLDERMVEEVETVEQPASIQGS